MELASVRSTIAALLEKGSLSEEVIKCLVYQDRFVPSEGLLFDYKRDLPSDRSSVCKIVRHIAAFHNTYGGYLLFGIDEVEKETKIVAHGIGAERLDLKQLKDLIRE